MAKKEKKLEVGVESKWDGKLSNRIGTWLLQLLVLAVMGGIGAGIAYALGVLDLINGAAFEAMHAVGIAVAAIFLLIGLSWAWTIGLRWKTKHTVINGYRMQFNASALSLFFNVLKWLFLTVITVCIYGLWVPAKYRNWKAKHTDSMIEEDEYGYGAPEISYYEYDEDED